MFYSFSLSFFDIACKNEMAEELIGIGGGGEKDDDKAGKQMTLLVNYLQQTLKNTFPVLYCLHPFSL